MEIIRGTHNIKSRHQECVVTIGNFDGLHLGHQILLQELMTKSKTLNLPSLVILFEPQPNEYFSDQPAPRLMRFREKVEALAEKGIDRVLCIPFNEDLAHQIAEDFVRKVLYEQLAAKFVLVGDDFKFGYKRLGDYQLLQALGTKYHFHTACMATYECLGERVSSSRIRQLLAVGNLTTAAMLLGRPYSMRGKIVVGDQRGRQLGFPTANISLQRKVIPLRGVFAVQMLGVSDHALPGVANIGTRPTLTGATRTLLEVHLLAFEHDIYGKQVEVIFLEKFREEKKFANINDLKEQIEQDVQRAITYHQQLPPQT